MHEYTTVLRIEVHTALMTYLRAHVQVMLPLLKYVRGEVLSPDHWHELFRMLGLPRGTTLEKLTFADVLSVSDEIISRCFVCTCMLDLHVMCVCGLFD